MYINWPFGHKIEERLVMSDRRIEEARRQLNALGGGDSIISRVLLSQSTDQAAQPTAATFQQHPASHGGIISALSLLKDTQ